MDSLGGLPARIWSQGLRVPFDFPTYRTILGPLWAPILQGILATRAYDDGVALAFNLLEGAERYAGQLKEEMVRDSNGLDEWDSYGLNEKVSRPAPPPAAPDPP